MFDRFRPRRGSPDIAARGRDRRHAGFYAIQDPYGSALDAFDEKFDFADSESEPARKRRNWWHLRWPWRRKTSDWPGFEPQTSWWQADHWRGRRKLWWLMRIIAALLALFKIGRAHV